MPYDPFEGATEAPQPVPQAQPSTPTDAGGFDPFAGATPGPSSMQPAAGPEQQQLGWSDIPGQLWQGIRHGVGDVSETFGGEGAGTPARGAAPFEWSDVTNPGGALAKFAYRTGEGSPTIAGGIAGGAAGAPVGPLTSIAGGALGAAAGSALQTMGPAFRRELQATPGDPDGAWSRALGSAMRAGAFSGVGWAAFPMRFFEGPLKNAAFQIFGVQPALSVAHQATENVAHGAPALEGATQAYTEGAVGTALPMAGHAAVQGLFGNHGEAAARKTAGKGEPATAEELIDIADRHYNDIEQANIRYTNPAELEGVRDRIHDLLYKAGADPRTEKRVFDAIDTLTESRRGALGVPDWSDIEHTRKMLNNAMGDRDPATRRAAALAIHDERNGLDAWIEDPQAQMRAGVHPDLAHDLAQKAALARSYWRAGKGMEAFDQIIEKANNASNAKEVTFRNEIRRIVNNPRLQWQYPPEAIDLMRSGLKRGFWQAAAHASKLFDPHSSAGLVANFLSHSMFGPEGLLAMPIAMGLRAIGQAPLQRVERQVPRMIAAQPEGGYQPPPGLLGRTARDYLGAGPTSPPATGGPNGQPSSQRASAPAAGVAARPAAKPDEGPPPPPAGYGPGNGANPSGGPGGLAPGSPGMGRQGAAGSPGGDQGPRLVAADADAFHAAIKAGAAANPHGASVEVHSPEEYRRMRTFMSPDHKAGVAVDGDNIVSVFKNPGSPIHGRDLLQQAIQAGGRRLDCFDTALPHIYGDNGFRAVARVPFNPEFAPPGWDPKLYAKYNNGQPDIVFMVYDPEHAQPYKAGDGIAVDGYDTASAMARHVSAQLWGGEGFEPGLREARSSRDMLSRGAWNFNPEDARTSWGETTKSFSIEPNDIPKEWKQSVTSRGAGRAPRIIHYDPQFAEELPPDPEFPTLRNVRMKPGVTDQFPTEREPGVIYRGMSFEEYQNALKSGFFKSHGDYNLGPEQEGLTFYSSRPEQAQNYAHGFAPQQYKATPTRPGVVVGVRDPGKYDYTTGETELGLREPVPTSDIRHVWFGRPAITRPGFADILRGNRSDDKWRSGSWAAPGATVRWTQEKSGGGAAERALRLARADGGGVDDDRPDQPPQDDIARAMTPPPTMWQSATPKINEMSGKIGDIVGTTAGIMTSPITNQARRMQDVYEHGIDWDDPQRVQDLSGGTFMDMAALAGPGGLASGHDPNAAGMFFRPEFSKLQRVSDLENAGWTPSEIWKDTNAFRDASGNLREEVLGPSKLKFDPRDVPAGDVKTMKWGDIVDAPHITQRSPFLADMDVKMYRGANDLHHGEYNPYTRMVGAIPQRPGPILIKPSIWTNTSNKAPLENLMHEGQHAIDQPAGYLRQAPDNSKWLQEGIDLQREGKASTDPRWKYYQDALALYGERNKDYAIKNAQWQHYRNQVDEVMARLSANREDMYNFLHELDPAQAQGFARTEPFAYGQSNYAEDTPRYLQWSGVPIRKRRGGAVGRALRLATRH